MFRELPNNISYPNIEESVLKFWDDNEIFEKSLKLREGNKVFTFYEGPPTVNGKPGIHHMMARTIKDAICRYKTMQGYYVRRQAGWDTHGLPVEIQVEKDLGIKNKSEVESIIGIEKFNKTCKDLVYKNIEMDQGWRTLTRRMGYWVDLDSAYITCTNDYIESVWWALKQLFDKDLIFKGFKVVPQSPTIETPLSSHELSLGYKEVKDYNCYIKLKVTSAKVSGTEDAELLVWTTTPWTLFSNVALAVGTDIDYVLVENKRELKEGTEILKLVLAKDRLETLDGEYTIIKSFKGSELIGTKYEQIFPYLNLKENEHPNALSIVEGDFVSTEDGSGIVHLAPAFGEDDYRLSLQFNLPFVQPVTPNGHLTEDLGPFAGRAIKDFEYDDRKEEGVEKDVVIALKVAGKIYRSQKDYLHNYPHCWRTGNPIMYYARESWFIKSPAYKERMIANNKLINWQPKEIGEGRFGNWLEDVKDWSLSRDRYWGTPLPLWINEDDNTDIIAVGSIEDLKKGKYEKEDKTLIPIEDSGEDIDLHRPFIDKIVFEKDGHLYRRVHEVIDVWFDSGSMPFAQMHYPFENKELFEQSFPADFIAEGIDQTRGWFYTLHNIATAIFDKPAYMNIVVNELILDKNGVKMSKRLGNTIDPFETMDKYGADAVRWYLFVNNPPWNTTKFNTEDIARVVISDFFRSLTQTYNFFSLYANIDKYDVNSEEVPLSKRPEIDKWILSRSNTVAKEYIALMDSYELTKAHRLVQDFAIKELSNWYIRRNRRRFWKGENDNDKLSAYQTLRRVFIRILQLTASTAPFLSEDLYQRLRSNSEPISIHLTDFMDINEDRIDTGLEEKMDLAQRIVYLARSLREKSQIKTRQPLQKILIPVLTPHFRRNIESMANIIKEELNIKEIEYMTDESSDIIKRNIRPDFRSLGAKYGKQTNTIAQEVKKFGDKEISQIINNGNYKLELNGEEYLIEDTDVEIYNEDIEGWLVANEKNITVALDTTISDALKNEGLAREFVNRIQNIRKESNFEVTDRIKILLSCNQDFENSIKEKEEYIKSETLANSISFEMSLDSYEEVEIDEISLKVGIEKIK